VKIYSSIYKSELLARIDFMDVESLTEFVEKDIEKARNWKVRPL
jgi:FAD synthase